MISRPARGVEDKGQSTRAPIMRSHATRTLLALPLDVEIRRDRDQACAQSKGLAKVMLGALWQRRGVFRAQLLDLVGEKVYLAILDSKCISAEARGVDHGNRGRSGGSDVGRVKNVG